MTGAAGIQPQTPDVIGLPACGEVMYGAECYGNHGTGQTDHVVRHAEIWGRKSDEQGLRVDTHKPRTPLVRRTGTNHKKRIR